MSDIYSALAAVMDDCKAVAKRDRNEHQKFMFRGIDAVVNAVGPILRKHAVVVVPNVENVHYDVVQTSTGKPATACRVLVTYTFYAGDGSSIDTRVAAEAWDAGDKAAPKAMSVAFRTALLQALALPTDESDPDAQTYERAPAPHREPPPREQASNPERVTAGGRGMASQAQVRMMGALMSKAGMTDRDDALAFVAATIGRKVGSRNELSSREASAVIDALQAPLPAAERGEGAAL
jgi:hypothetical protein